MSSSAESAVREAVEFLIQFVENPLPFLVYQWEQHPYHIVIEVAFCVAFVYFYFIPLHRAKASRIETMTSKEEDMMLQEFVSAPFKANRPDSNAPVAGPFGGAEVMPNVQILGRSGVKATIRGPKGSPLSCLDLATFDYHSLSTAPEIRETAKHLVVTYGVGSCGPRGFYGTVKPHLDLESHIAAFLGVDACIIYSFSFATVSTLIPCYSSRGDYIVVDSGVCLPIQEGCHLSRSNVSYARHNDLFHMEELMSTIQRSDDKKKKISRRFLVTEGVFRNSGDICQLREILELCNKYKFRLILEDSYGFGVLGATGRGTPEHFQIPTSLIDFYIGSMATSLGTVGGFCAGSATMVDHQRLAATGYVFSASLPPYMTGSASKALEMIQANPNLVGDVQRNAKAFRAELRTVGLPANLKMIDSTDDVSPLVHIRVECSYIREVGKQRVEEQLARVVESLQTKSILVLRHLYTAEERVENWPSLRVVIKSGLTPAQVGITARTIIAVLRVEFRQ
ncbi:serine-palmitoyl-CoA transferase, putative [Bodo saltans]|uniref:serine C-palmitoyltransferase n=1 Tax=Bodo saltans TaxID=75058 RepID=A0A0S4KPJ9_BODSA|nr:serine-palmitoyl-CoA transferase, putative [Bodo saltans]|eukprot:CUI15559.1 serine-palmitoyl-CoA transferase, putative [Bodo saltans]